MKRKLIKFISVSLLTAALVSLYGCNSDDSHESSVQEQDIEFNKKYYAALYEEQEPILYKEDLVPEIPTIMEFTDTKVQLYNSSASYYATHSYTIKNGIFSTVFLKDAYFGDFISHDNFNCEIRKSNGCFYLKLNINDKAYDVKYSQQNILEGKYKLTSEPLPYGPYGSRETITELEFNGNEVTITFSNGSSETYEYTIYGQKVLCKKQYSITQSFKMYGYTDSHFFANAQRGQYSDIYDEYIRVD